MLLLLLQSGKSLAMRATQVLVGVLAFLYVEFKYVFLFFHKIMQRFTKLITDIDKKRIYNYI